MSVSTSLLLGAASSTSSSMSSLQSNRISAGEEGLATCLKSLWEFVKVSESSEVIEELTKLSKLADKKISQVTEMSIKDVTGRSIDKVNDKLRAIVFKFVSSMPEEKKKEHLLVCIEGKIHNLLKAEMSAIEFRALECSPMTLQKIYFCQSSLSSGSDSSFGRLKAIFVHEFLIVETEVVLFETKYRKYFKAEKVGRPAANAGIVIRCADASFNDDGVCECENFEIICGKSPITLRTLENILQDYEKNYSLKNSCCWDYAKDMSKKLLEFCMDLPQINKFEKKRLTKELVSLEHRIRRLGNAAKEMMTRAGEFIKENLQQLTSETPSGNPSSS